MYRPGKTIAAILASLCWPLVCSAQFPSLFRKEPQNGPVYPVTKAPESLPGFSFGGEEPKQEIQELPPETNVAQPEQSTAAPTIGSDPSEQEVSTEGARIYKEGEIIAIVGNQHILYGDVAGTVNQQIELMSKKATSAGERAQIENYRDQLTRQVLNSIVEYKIFYQEFERELKGKAKDKVAEARREMDRKVRKMFEENLIKTKAKLATATKKETQELLQQDPFIPRLALLMKENELESMGDLDIELRRVGSSLEKEVRGYGEYNMGRSIFPSKVNFKPEVTYLEMLEFYKGNPDKYAVPAKARWEHLMVKFSSHPTKEEAWKRIADMGNKVFFGAPLDAVARDFSEDTTKSKGGLHDWTAQGVLASEKLDNALFTLDLNKLSQIIEDERGFHIIRVLERKEAGYIPFTEAQVEIKETIANQKRQKSYKEFIADLKSRTKIWTIYDAQDELARQKRAAAQTQQR